MKMKALVAFRSKIFKPFLAIFRFKLKKPFSIKDIRLHSRRNKPRRSAPKRRLFPLLLSCIRPFRKLSKMDRLMELRSISGQERERMLFPSPVTPASLCRAGKNIEGKHFVNEAVEDACRSFENYLVEMIVEEGKVGDLMDVEELLYCWKNLKCPVFVDLVCRFYGELCKDLFLPEDDQIDTASPR